MTAEISHRRPLVLETRSHASPVSLGKTPYSPPATPGLPPSTMSPLDAKHTRTDALSISDNDEPGSLQPPSSLTQRTHRPPTPPPPGSSADDVVDVSSLCLLPTSPSAPSMCHHASSIYPHHQQLESPAELAVIDENSSYTGTSSQQAVTMGNTMQQQSQAVDDAASVYPEDMYSTTTFSSRPPSIYAQQKPGQQTVHHHHQILPYRHTRRNPLLSPIDYCYHYSPAFPSPASQQAARSSLRRLRRRSLHRSNNLTGVSSTSPTLLSSRPLEEQQQQQQLALPPSQPSMQPFRYNPASLRGRRRVTIEKYMHAWEQQQEHEADDQDSDNNDNVRIGGYEVERRERAGNMDGGVDLAATLVTRRAWSESSSDDWPQPPAHLYAPSPCSWQARMEEDMEVEEEEGDWGAPELVDSVGEEGLHLGPWASAAY
ncbi:hypothetical protein BGZ73_002042 [Actinomortierella ambigua]|nr:hypothetical protein BGZ73_002042 [Actinomortierella ambigua]